MSRKRKNRSVAKAYAVIVDGETEQWYLQMLRKNEPSLNVVIEPKLHVRQSLKEQCMQVEKACKSYDKVFWVVDMDSILKDSKICKKNPTPLQILKDNIEILKKSYPEIFVGVFNVPCLEFWFMLHYKYTSRFYESYEKLKPDLIKYLKGYQKNKDYFVRGPQDIYARLKENLDTAVTNSRKLGDFDFANVSRGVSEFSKFFEQIGIA